MSIPIFVLCKIFHLQVLDGLDLLQVTLEKTEAHKAELEAKMKLCEDRMNRAVRLISGLADEKDRWAITIKNLAKSFESVVGDVLISAGKIVFTHFGNVAVGTHIFE